MYTVIFDLDGTISDPAEGITRSINYALAKLGYDTYPEKDLLPYIGPHLRITFAELVGIGDDATLSRAIELYRERYIPIGYKENRLYDGIVPVLESLIADDNRLCIATTKREDIASKVLEFLKIDHFFTQVRGCDLDRTKAAVLQDILSHPVIGDRPAVMIGDRDTDFLAASAVDIPSIAVRWGYGTGDEYALATDTVGDPGDLRQVIMRVAR